MAETFAGQVDQTLTVPNDPDEFVARWRRDLWSSAHGRVASHPTTLAQASQHRKDGSVERPDFVGGRDLKRMVEAELLEPKGEKRGRYYIATPRLLSLAEASWEEERGAEQVDPFAEVTDPEVGVVAAVLAAGSVKAAAHRLAPEVRRFSALNFDRIASSSHFSVTLSGHSRERMAP